MSSRRRFYARLGFLTASSVVAGHGCELEGVFVAPELTLARMHDQARFDAYEVNSMFIDARSMRPPPIGTVHRSAAVGDLPTTRGIDAHGYVTKVPVPVTRALLRRGRTRFEIFCAACHGILGDGASVVASNMELVRPPSLLDPMRHHPPGRIYRTIREGSGLMPALGGELSVEDRWAVVAYLEALTLSQQVHMAELPTRILREAEEALL